MDILASLSRELPPEALVTATESLDSFSHDMAETVIPGSPIAAVQPSTTDEVASVLRLAQKHQVPIVPRGAGTGLSGGAAAVEGCIVVSLLRMNRVLEMDPLDSVAVVQPGVVTAEVSRAAEPHGLTYMPDPASFEISSVGGNLSTNAGGLRCLRFGATRESVLGLEVVLPGGETLRTGGRAIKDVAGYDLTSLFVGSEGTLGIITEAIVRLRPPPPPQATALASFDSLESAGDAASSVLRTTTPTVMELMDSTTVNAIEDWRPAGLRREAHATLIVQCDADPPARAELLARRLEEAGASELVWSTDAAESLLIMGIRRLAYPALERLGATILDDVSVPIGQITRLLSEIGKVGNVDGVTVATFGHAGDGNLHPTLIYRRGDAEAGARAIQLAAAISDVALSLGGSVTGEHGVGTLKRDWYRSGADAGSLDLMRRIKQVIDPRGIMNPGKVW